MSVLALLAAAQGDVDEFNPLYIAVGLLLSVIVVVVLAKLLTLARGTLDRRRSR